MLTEEMRQKAEEILDNLQRPIQSYPIFHSERISDRMKKLGWNLKVTAERTGLKVSTLDQYLRRNRVPNGIALIKLASGMGITVESLFDYERSRKKDEKTKDHDDN